MSEPRVVVDVDTLIMLLETMRDDQKARLRRVLRALGVNLLPDARAVAEGEE